MDRIEHFSKNDSRASIEVLERCRLFVGAGDAIASVLAVGSLKSLEKGQPFITQDERTDGIYFILEGEVDILVNGRGIASRSAPNFVGESPVLDSTAKRNATVIPLEDCVTLHVASESFIQVANKYPKIWQNLALEISERLRERGLLVDEMGKMPKLFIGSSAEYLEVAYAIQEGLLHEDVSVNVWSQDCFRPSEGTLASLERAAQNSDFALLLFGGEDLVISRDEEKSAPRDNVIYELGLFTGRLSSQRVYFAKEIGVDLKMPSDLLGITPIQYRRKGDEALSISVQPICNKLVQMINLHGPK